MDIFLILSGLNAFLFIFIGMILGGMAFTGEVNANGYYLGQGEILTKVSSTAYRYSFWHGMVVFTTVPLSVVLFWVFKILKKPR